MKITFFVLVTVVVFSFVLLFLCSKVCRGVIEEANKERAKKLKKELPVTPKEKATPDSIFY